MLVTAAARLDLTPLRSDGVLPPRGVLAPRKPTGTLTMRVADSAGKALITTAETPVQVPAGGGVLKGQLDLSGLPPGQYTMVAVPGSSRDRRSSAPPSFTMAGLDETLEKDVARREAAKVTDEGYFDAMDEEAARRGRGAARS